MLRNGCISSMCEDVCSEVGGGVIYYLRGYREPWRRWTIRGTSPLPRGNGVARHSATRRHVTPPADRQLAAG